MPLFFFYFNTQWDASVSNLIGYCNCDEDRKIAKYALKIKFWIHEARLCVFATLKLEVYFFTCMFVSEVRGLSLENYISISHIYKSIIFFVIKFTVAAAHLHCKFGSVQPTLNKCKTTPYWCKVLTYTSRCEYYTHQVYLYTCLV